MHDKTIEAGLVAAPAVHITEDEYQVCSGNLFLIHPTQLLLGSDARFDSSRLQSSAAHGTGGDGECGQVCEAH